MDAQISCVGEPKQFTPVSVVANDVRAIDSAIQEVTDASRNLDAETELTRITENIRVSSRSAHHAER